jgi:fructokinase
MIASFGEILFDVYPDRELLGGAPFNFLYHIHALTGDGLFISRVGNDERGKKIRSFLEQHSINREHVQIDLHHPTGAAFVAMDKNGIPSFTIAEETAYDFIEPDAAALDAVAASEMFYFGTLVQRSDASRTTLYELSRQAEQCFFDVNLRQHYYSTEILHRSLTLADIVKLNEQELRIVHSLFFSTPFSLDTSPLLLMEKFSLTHLAVTLGENGSWIWTPTEKYFHKTIASVVRDTVGAGDAFAAMMCLGIVKGWSVKLLHERASAFSAAVCGIDGALPPDNSFYDQYRKIV